MRAFSVAASLSGLFALASSQAIVDGVATGTLGDAEIIYDNPVGVTYTATLLEKNTTSVRGYISGSAAPNGTGVIFTVEFYNFPSTELLPYIYHIHDQPVSSDGNCTTTKAHQDPYIRGEKPLCDPTQPQTCQVGDLSGKHGNITELSYSAQYYDLYASTKDGIGAFFGNRSIVVHAFNTTRLNCANFTLDTSGEQDVDVNIVSNATASASDGSASPTESDIPVFTGAASALSSMRLTSFAAVAGGLFGALLLA